MPGETFELDPTVIIKAPRRHHVRAINRRD
jgi:hypothetical protein